MRVELVFRFLGAVACGVGGWYLAEGVTSISQNPQQPGYVVVAISLAGFGIGWLITPYLTLHPLLWLRDHIRHIPAQDLAAATIGLLIGLILSALLAIPLSLLPYFFGKLLPIVAAIVLGYLGIVTMISRKKELFNLFGGRFGGGGGSESGELAQEVIVDTSAIIDGRIADISQTGFISGTLVVPRFVLIELQHIADSADALRRNRGRRGLEMLNKLQKESVVPLRVIEAEINGAGDVDGNLVKMAKQRHCPIITNDFNLNRVAALQGVRVLNINELANAVKSIVLPGEEMSVRIIQEGKEHGQGVAYLDDGTMIVVEGGRRYINADLDVIVTRVLQTVAGRMIFAHPKELER